jgi:hypothetical protein
MINDSIETPDQRSRDLMMRVARSPRFCCGCICLSSEDRNRSKRIFKLTRAILRDWSNPSPV